MPWAAGRGVRTKAQRVVPWTVSLTTVCPPGR